MPKGMGICAHILSERVNTRPRFDGGLRVVIDGSMGFVIGNRCWGEIHLTRNATTKTMQ